MDNDNYRLSTKLMAVTATVLLVVCFGLIIYTILAIKPNTRIDGLVVFLLVVVPLTLGLLTRKTQQRFRK